MVSTPSNLLIEPLGRSDRRFLGRDQCSSSIVFLAIASLPRFVFIGRMTITSSLAAASHSISGGTFSDVWVS
ncbi:hypothetical protein BVC80_8989g33 [Macleaya cordata]|uniref:Uncharacterized protein n=1 Tax=Macleaya cordata TaxID=56857 RepID=A0A200Q8F4_MACCD|nr:hypothetical protein BVC80_8989g33 [Macleaya cordata]